MKCPQCGNDNAPGKLMCISCGAKLPSYAEQGRQAPGAKETGGGKPVIKPARRRRSGGGAGAKLVGGLVFLLILLVAGAALMALQQPPAPALQTNREALDSGVAAVNRGLGDMAYGRPGVITLKENEANSLIEEGLKGQGRVAAYFGGGALAASSVKLKLNPDEVTAYVGTSFKGRPLLLELTGSLAAEDGYIVASLRLFRVGRLSLPPELAPKVLPLLAGVSSPLRFTFADLYVRSLELSGGKATVKLTPDKPGTNPADRLIEEASTLAAQGQFAAAIIRLVQIKEEFADSKVVPEAEEMLKKINEQARKLIEEGQAYYAQGKYDQADKVYNDVVNRFAGTAIAEQAGQMLAMMREDPLVLRFYRIREADAVANNIYQLGDNFYRNGFVDKAEEQWRVIVEQYPESTYASKAKERLQALGR